MKPYFGMTGAKLTFWVSVACFTDMALFGYDQGVFGGVNVSPDYLNTMGFSGTSIILSTVTAIYDVASFIGALLTMWIGEKYGRKNTIILGSCLMLIGAILQTTAYSVPHIIVARVISGVGNGLNTATAPIWQSETSKASMRGMLVVGELILNIGGFSLSNWIAYGFSFLEGGVTWRFPIAFQLVFIFILLGTVPWLPESPRWLIKHGRIEEAERIIADLESSTIDDPYVVTLSKEIQWADQVEKENDVPWSKLLTGRTAGKGTKTLRRLLLGMGTQAMQQLAGINVTSYYLPTVLENSVHLNQRMAQLLAACNSVSYLIFGSLSIPIVEKQGRRFLMLVGSAGQGVCYLIITVLIRYTEKEGWTDGQKTQVGSASIAFFFLYYVFFGFGWQGVPWLYPAEINSLGMRTKGCALGTATNWIVNFMVVEITPPGIDSLHWRFYIIWTVFNFAFLPIIYFLYPETANRSLEDMDRYFTENPTLLVFRDKDATSKRRPLRYAEDFENAVRRNSSIGSVSQKTQRRISELAGSDDFDEEKRATGMEKQEDVNV